MFKKKISIIIPTFKEENSILQTLRQFQPHENILEIIVVDAGSSDRTRELIREFQEKAQIPTELLESREKGRGNQMQLGFEHAKGDIIHFVHADATLQPDFHKHVVEALEDSDIVGGAFSIQFTNPHPVYRLIALSSNSRSRFAGLYHGDQGMFVKRSALETIGGVPTIPLMEDVELSRRMKKVGKTKKLKSKIIASSRRMEANGIWKSAYVYVKLYTLYYMGYSPYKIRDIYEKMKKE